MNVATNVLIAALTAGLSSISFACPLLKESGSISCAGGGYTTNAKMRVAVNHWAAGSTTGCFSNTTFKLIDTVTSASVPLGSSSAIGVGGLTTAPLVLQAGRGYKFQIWGSALLSETITRVAPSCPAKWIKKDTVIKVPKEL